LRQDRHTTAAAAAQLARTLVISLLAPVLNTPTWHRALYSVALLEILRQKS
jgi:hypothetical protein